MENAFAPYSALGLLILRLALGVLFLYHGWPKLNPNSPMKGPVGVAGFLKQMGFPLPVFFAGLLLCWRR